jgi:hypothetical protein
MAVVDHLCLRYPDHKWALNFNFGARGPKRSAR